jgi:hypothetical protein
MPVAGRPRPEHLRDDDALDVALLEARAGPPARKQTGSALTRSSRRGVAVRIGIAVIRPEGAAAPTVAAADIVYTDIRSALDLLLDDSALISTVRP